jgi:hypothetical protein
MASGNHRPAAPYYQEGVDELDLPERVRVAQTEIAHAARQAFSRLATGDRSGGGGGDLQRRGVGCEFGALNPFVPMLSPFPSSGMTPEFDGWSGPYKIVDPAKRSLRLGSQPMATITPPAAALGQVTHPDRRARSRG